MKSQGQDFGIFESLLSASAVRERCHRIGEIVLAGHGHWFTINQSNLNRCVELVADSCLKNYPDLKIPIHSRWRHFEIDGINLWEHYTRDFKGYDRDLARSAIDLVFVSVLLDAGAGEAWKYNDPVTGQDLNRSEGLAAASMDLFFNHLSAFDSSRGWWISTENLTELSRSRFSRSFQHSPNNPLLGVDGRYNLLQGLAQVLDPDTSSNRFFHRPGNIVDDCLELVRQSRSSKLTVDATQVLSIVLDRFSSIWPNGYIEQGINLGDCGNHSLLVTEDETSEIVPFHKLSQWLTYSLVEPLQWAGFEVTNMDGLTGLPEYRNGGLLLDTGVLVPVDSAILNAMLSLESEAVVEWRAVTVYMLDQIADLLRNRLKMSPQNLPLGSVLQGGTWAAGRELAAKIRPDASPPLNLNIDGTIF